MPEFDKDSKTEQATSKKLGKARDKGQVVHSKEVDTVAILFFGTVILYFIGPWMMKRIMMTSSSYFKRCASIEVSRASVQQLTGSAIMDFVVICAPFVLLCAVVGVIVNLAQVKFLWTTEPLKWKLSSIQPKLSKINFFKKDNLLTLCTSVGKLFIIAPIAAATIYAERMQFVQLMDMNSVMLYKFVAMLAFKIVMRVCIAMVFLAAADYFYQKWKHADNLKMTKQEVKDERKDAEGDPKVKSKQKQNMMQFMYHRMMAAVPKADVVVTNPTHYAVALKYDSSKMKAPKVVAKGARLVAKRIKELAKENKVPVIENKPLAQALFKSVKVGQEIPAVFYKAVAELLAFIYRVSGKIKPVKG